MIPAEIRQKIGRLRGNRHARQIEVFLKIASGMALMIAMNQPPDAPHMDDIARFLHRRDEWRGPPPPGSATSLAGRGSMPSVIFVATKPGSTVTTCTPRFASRFLSPDR